MTNYVIKTRADEYMFHNISQMDIIGGGGVGLNDLNNGFGGGGGGGSGMTIRYKPTAALVNPVIQIKSIGAGGSPTSPNGTATVVEIISPIVLLIYRIWWIWCDRTKRWQWCNFKSSHIYHPVQQAFHMVVVVVVVVLLLYLWWVVHLTFQYLEMVDLGFHHQIMVILERIMVVEMVVDHHIKMVIGGINIVYEYNQIALIR